MDNTEKQNIELDEVEVSTTEKTFCRTWTYLLNNPEKKADNYKRIFRINGDRYKNDEEYKKKMIEYQRNYYKNNEAFREKKKQNDRDRYLAKKLAKQLEKQNLSS